MALQELLTATYQDLVAYPFLQRALAAALLVSVTCSMLSVFVVLKKLAFIGQGISHSAFGGIALGMWLFPALAAPDIRVYAITTGFCVLVAFFIAYASRSNMVSEDSAIGIFFVSSMALGTILLSMRKSYTNDVTSYLFGKALAVSNQDLLYLSILAGIVMLAVIFYYRDLYAYCFDAVFADVIGLPTTFLHYLLLFLLALTIVLSVKVVGIILVTAYLVIPGACAMQLTFRFRWMLLLSVLLGAASAIAGIAASNALPNMPAGALIVLFQFSFFILLLAFHQTKRWFTINE